MSKSAMIRARMDPQLKDEVEQILDELGLSTTQALTLFYQQIRMNKGIPFRIRIPVDESQRTSRSIEPLEFSVNVNRSTMDENAAAYRAMHRELLQRHLGQYVAISGGKLVDHDSDPVALLRRVRADFPNQIVLRRKVEPAAEQTLHIRRPQIEQDA